MEKSPPILLVEDDEDDAFFILKAFHSLDLPITIQHCRNGREALDYLKPLTLHSGGESTGLPQLIVLDLKMPGMSGFDILEWIQSHGKNLRAVVVILTSSTSESEASKAKEYDINAYWIKPIGLKDMKEVVRCICHLWLHHIPAPLQKNLFELAS